MRTPPRFPLALLPTPLHRAPRLEAAAGGGPLLLKRDDLVGFAVAGNKVRPLEYLLGDALARGADTLVTGGGPGSNFVAAAATAAAVAGLACELVVWGDPAGSANLALAVAAGARLHLTGSGDREAVDRIVAERAAAIGPRAYPVPRGGSTPVGAVGFAVAAAELDTQLTAQGVDPALIVLPLGSGGSTAGLLAGLAATGRDTPVLAVSVSRPPAEITARVHTLARGCAELLCTPPRTDRLEVLDARGAGFGTASPREREHARLALRAEGLLLDQTYGAQAFSATVDRLRAGAAGPVVHWLTGGLLPALGTITRGCP